MTDETTTPPVGDNPTGVDFPTDPNAYAGPNPDDPAEIILPPDTTDLFAAPLKSDKYRKGIPPTFQESMGKYYQDELTKIERVLDLAYDDSTKIAKDGAKLQASFSDEVRMRVTEDEALVVRIQKLNATVNSDRVQTSAMVKTEQIARATRDDALAQNIVTVSADLKTASDSLSAKIVSETTARVNADGALSQRIDTLTSTVGANTSAITQEAIARASADSATATTVSNLSTTVGQNSANISQTMSSVNGLKAKWGVKINNNNRVAGVSLNSDETGYSNFDVEANAFTIYAPGTTNKMIYWDGSTLVVKGDITANKITASAFVGLPDNVIARPILAKPNILGSGTYYTTAQQFRSGGYRTTMNTETAATESEPVPITLFIPTGLYIDSGWTYAPTNVYAATAIMSGTGSCSGYASATVLIGDGTMSDVNSSKGQIYIRYNWEPANGSGTITINSIAWKIVQI